jgi:hypothetical protein
MLEQWNNGFKKTSIRNAQYFSDFLVLMEYFAEKPESRSL